MKEKMLLTELKNEKSESLELLRLVLMIMICVEHIMDAFDALILPGAESEPVRYVGMLLESFCIMSGNAFAVLSGYLLVDKKFKLRRFIELLCTVLFYSFVITLIVFFISRGSGRVSNIFNSSDSFFFNDGVFKIVQNLFPVSSSHYWFMSVYLILYILSPVLNKGFSALDPGTRKTVLALLIIFCSVIKSVVPVNFVTDDKGYGIKWLICLYLIGAYIRLEEAEAVCKNTMTNAQIKQDEAGGVKDVKNGKLLYLAGSLLVYIFALVFYEINISTGGFSYFLGIVYDCNFIPTLVSTVGLFLVFKNMKIKSEALKKMALRFAHHALGIYLVQSHPLLFYTWPALFALAAGEVPRDNVFLFLLYSLAALVIFFVAGILADMLRAWIFKEIAMLIGADKCKGC